MDVFSFLEDYFASALPPCYDCPVERTAPNTENIMYAIYINIAVNRKIHGSCWVLEAEGFADFHAAAHRRDELVYSGVPSLDLEIRRVK